MKCPYCGRLMFSPANYRGRLMKTRDHIRPREWGGNDDSDNIRLVCSECNGLRPRCGHCHAALMIAWSVGRDTQRRAVSVITLWNLPRIHVNPSFKRPTPTERRAQYRALVGADI